MEQAPTAPPNGPEAHRARADERDEPHLARLCALRPEVETVLGGTTHAGELGDASPEARTQLLEALVAWRKDLEGQMSESRERTLDARETLPVFIQVSHKPRLGLEEFARLSHEGGEGHGA